MHSQGVRLLLQVAAASSKAAQTAVEVAATALCLCASLHGTARLPQVGEIQQHHSGLVPGA